METVLRQCEGNVRQGHPYSLGILIEWKQYISKVELAECIAESLLARDIN